nr:unnamed protein product [Callosobruchus chinensis]
MKEEMTSQLSTLTKMLEAAGLKINNQKEAERTSSKRRKMSNGSSDEEGKPKEGNNPSKKHHVEKIDNKIDDHNPTLANTNESVENEVMDQEPSTSAPTSEDKKEKRPPPIYIHREDQWKEVVSKKQLKMEKPARLTRVGIKIQPKTAEDYRAAKTTLRECGVEHHTYSLPQDKPLSIAEDLKEKGFHPVSIYRLTSRRTKKLTPLVKVDVPRDEQGIYKLTECCLMRVTVEALKKREGPGQCYRCQMFGHSQTNCTGAPRCVRCAGSHRAQECKVPDTHKPKCVNCAGEHPASYGGCPHRPKARRPGKHTESPRQISNPRPVVEGRSYAASAKGQVQTTRSRPSEVETTVRLLTSLKGTLRT